MTFSHDLLSQADFLLKRSEGKPRQADLRRSVSAAYYALFHFIVDVSSSAILSARFAGLKAEIRRTIAHVDLKKACVQLRSEEFNKAGILGRVWTERPSAEIRILANAVVDLQKLRHTADYDLSKPLAKIEAQAAVDRSRAALNSWASVSPDERINFSIFLLFHDRLRKDV
jgi:hypothetical protein